MRVLTKDDTAVHYRVFDTDIGPVGLAWSAVGVMRLQLPEANRAATERRLRGRSAVIEEETPPVQVERAIAEVQRYLAGERVDLSDIDLDLAGVGSFHARIYELLRRIGWGETTTYGALARRAGEPGASRAVGQAMGRNPVPIIIPCHRVLASGGKPGGFSAFGGADTKQRLLALEGVTLGRAATPLLPGLLSSARPG